MYFSVGIHTGGCGKDAAAVPGHGMVDAEEAAPIPSVPLWQRVKK
jgi:hypothetical protein